MTGTDLKNWRTAHGLTLADLAAIIRVKPETVDSWEKFEARPSYSNWETLSAIKRFEDRLTIRLRPVVVNREPIRVAPSTRGILVDRLATVLIAAAITTLLSVIAWMVFDDSALARHAVQTAGAAEIESGRRERANVATRDAAATTATAGSSSSTASAPARIYTYDREDVPSPFSGEAGQ